MKRWETVLYSTTAVLVAVTLALWLAYGVTGYQPLEKPEAFYALVYLTVSAAVLVYIPGRIE